LVFAYCWVCAFGLSFVMEAAKLIPVEKRDTFLQRVAAALQQRAGPPSPMSIAEAIKVAKLRLVQEPQPDPPGHA
jgi:hypothetical protein